MVLMEMKYQILTVIVSKNDLHVALEVLKPLEARGLKVLLDLIDLIPDDALLKDKNNIIGRSKAIAIFVGAGFKKSDWDIPGISRILNDSTLNKTGQLLLIMLQGAKWDEIPEPFKVLRWVELHEFELEKQSLREFLDMLVRNNNK